MSPSWTCPTCNATVATAYCPTCGESRPQPRDLTLRGLADQLFVALSNVDSKLLRTLRSLVLAPGALTVAYLKGQRMPFLRPFPLFLLANVVFFATQSLTGSNVFSSALDSHLHQQDWRELAQQMLAARLAVTGGTLETYAPVFDRAVILNGKSLVVLMTIPFALLLTIMFRGSQRTVVGHYVFALHVYAFLLLLFCLSLVVAAINTLLGGPGLASPAVDSVLSSINLAVCALYLFLAVRRVYGETGLPRLLTTAVLAIAVGAIGLAYRFGLFVLTLHTT